MTAKTNITTTAAAAGMELCWLHAWAVFLLVSIFGRGWPLALSVGIFALAAITPRMLSRYKGHRAVLLLLRMLVFNTGLTIVLIAFRDPSFRLTESSRMSDYLSSAGGPHPWLFLFTILAITLAIWKRGGRLASHPPMSANAYSRFDIALTAFLVLLIVKALLFVRGGVSVPDPEVTRILFLFLFLSLLSISAGRHAREGRKEYIHGFRKIGVVLSFSTAALALGIGLAALFYSDLITGAEILSDGLKKTAAPLEPLLKTMLRFLLMHNMKIKGNASTFGVHDSGSPGSPAVGEPSAGILWEIIQRTPAGLVLVTFLFIFCLAVVILFKILLPKTDPAAGARGGRRLLPAWMKTLKELLISFMAFVRRRIKGCACGVELFAALAAWGRLSGAPRRPVETPGEYGFRLMAAFPGLEKEIGVIIELLHRQYYGEILLDTNEVAMGRQALKELKRMIHWPMRIKTWLFSNDCKSNLLEKSSLSLASIESGKDLPKSEVRRC